MFWILDFSDKSIFAWTTIGVVVPVGLGCDSGAIVDDTLILVVPVSEAAELPIAVSGEVLLEE